MASRADRLQPVIDIAKGQTEQQLRLMGERQRNLAEGERQLNELKNYRDAYEHPAEATTIENLLNRQQFVESIGSVVVRQQNEVSRLTRQYNFARNEWLKARSHEQALEALAERFRQQDRLNQDRLEQSENDERTLTQHLAKLREKSRNSAAA
jgi:flagellar protein FliJ